jgi:phage gp29-like protein
MAQAPKAATSTRRTVGKTLEMATRLNSIDFAYFGGFLPNPDTVLKKMGKDITVYEELKADAHLGSVVSQRKSGVKSLLWEIDRGKSKSRQAKAITERFNTLPVASIISEIMDAPFYGYQPIEVVWEAVAGGLDMPVKVVGKPPEWFHFNEENELRWRSKQNPFLGEPIPSRKFLLPRHNATYKNPYGEPLLSRCFWPVTFKRSGIKFWITFAEKYGMPWPVGKLPRNSGEKEYEKLRDNLEAMVQDALAVIPNDASIEFLESGSKTASADVFQALVKWANDEMSKAAVGHTGAGRTTPKQCARISSPRTSAWWRRCSMSSSAGSARSTSEGPRRPSSFSTPRRTWTRSSRAGTRA